MRLTGLVLSQSFSGVCEVDQIPYPMSGNRSRDSLLFTWQPAKYMFSMPPTGTAAHSYLKSITSTVLCFFFHPALSPGMYHGLIHFDYILFFAWVYLFINFHSECHMRASFGEKKNIAFPISGSYELLALIAIVTIIPLQRCIFSAAALHRGTGTSNLRGSLAAKLDCTGWDSMRHRECAFNLKKVNVHGLFWRFTASL